tara:strand:- start:231 stop:500 length:270 start_codon:yes stop_codon:yes gene_type:complete
VVDTTNIFYEPKSLKKWSIKLANACGGQEVSQTSIRLNKTNTKKIAELVDKFVNDHNETRIALEKLEKEKDNVVFQGKEVQLDKEEEEE